MRVLLFLLVFSISNLFAFENSDLMNLCQKYGYHIADEIKSIFKLENVVLTKDCSVKNTIQKKYKVILKGNYVYLDSTLLRVALIKKKEVVEDEVQSVVKRIEKFYEDNGYIDVKVDFTLKDNKCLIYIKEGDLYIISGVELVNVPFKYKIIPFKIFSTKRLHEILSKVKEKLRENGYFDAKIKYNLEYVKYNYPFFNKDKFISSIISVLPFYHKIVKLKITVDTGEKYNIVVKGVVDRKIQEEIKKLFVKSVERINSFYVGFFKEKSANLLKSFGYENGNVEVELKNNTILISVFFNKYFKHINIRLKLTPKNNKVEAEINNYLKTNMFDLDKKKLTSLLKKIAFSEGYCNPKIESAYAKDDIRNYELYVDINLGKQCNIGNIFLNNEKIYLRFKSVKFSDIDRIKSELIKQYNNRYFFRYINFEKYEVDGDNVNLYFIGDLRNYKLKNLIYYDSEAVYKLAIKRYFRKDKKITKYKIDKVRSYLKKVGFYSASSVTVVPVNNGEALIAIYNKVDYKNQVYGGFGFTSVNGLNAYIGYRRFDFANHNLNLVFFKSKDEVKGNLSLLGYNYLGEDIYDELGFIYRYKKEKHFKVNSKKVFVQLSKSYINKTLSTTFMFDDLKEYNFDYDLTLKNKVETKKNIVGLRGSITFKNLDLIINPLNGYALSFNGNIYRNLQKLFFYEINVGCTLFKSLFKEKYLFSMAVKSGKLFGNDSSIPLSYRFTLGGPQMMRGYGVDDIGEEDSTGKVFGGKNYFYNEIAFNKLIRKNVLIGLFFESGNAGDDYNKIFRYKDLGISFELRTPIGPLKLSYANNYFFSNKKSQAFYITFGRIF
ncbi:BamA/TamA family outer membrane protein [Deferribacter abyssi]|uniref:BamA/TamA family outer membrane protein n=1 Tax=Deferribacter abyssi TaxID=213806 RepID=UPI003C1910FB